jgi:site-specific recombinase XerD
MRRWDGLQDAYLEEYRARGLSAATEAHTELQLERWGRWLKKQRPRVAIEAIDAESISAYLGTRSSFHAKSTVYLTLSMMRGFGEYLVRRGVWRTNPMRWMKGPKVRPYNRLPRRIDQADMEALWRAAAGRGGGYSGRLWVTILALLYGTGLRRGELVRMNLGAFDREQATLRIDGRKTGEERMVPLPEMVQRCLEEYLPARHNQLEEHGRIEETALLVGMHGRRLTHEGISNGIHAIARAAGVPPVTLHQFRHSCASDLLEAGVHLAEVQRILGHRVIETTVRYVHLADPARRAAMALHPINEWLRPRAVSA